MSEADNEIDWGKYSRDVSKHPSHSFRMHQHETSDGRKFCVHQMETQHIINTLRKFEQNYCKTYGFVSHLHHNMVVDCLYRGNASYCNMQKELAYRRWMKFEAIDFDIYSEAAVYIQSTHNLANGTTTSRWKSNNVNISNYPKPKEPTGSTTQNMITLLQKDFYTVGAKFDDSTQAYTYKVPNKVKLEKDDYVVTKTTGKGFGIAKVVRVDAIPQIDPHAHYEYTWIVQKVESAAFDAQIKLEKELKTELLQVETAHQREQLVEKMTKHLDPDSEASKVFRSIREKAGNLVIGTDYQEVKAADKTDAA